MSPEPHRVTLRVTRPRVALALFLLVFAATLAATMSGTHEVVRSIDTFDEPTLTAYCEKLPATVPAAREPASWCVTELWGKELQTSGSVANGVTLDGLVRSITGALFVAALFYVAWWLIARVRLHVVVE